MKFPDFDLYAELGVPRTAKAADIKQAYRTLARKYHPDGSVEPDCEERFKRISLAYAILSDEQQRREYDEHITWLRQQQLERSGTRITVSTGGSPIDFYLGPDESWGNNWRMLVSLAFGMGWQDDDHPIAARVGRTLDWAEVRLAARRAIKVAVCVLALALLWGFILSL